MQKINSASLCYHCDGYEYKPESIFFGIALPEREGCRYGYWGNPTTLWSVASPKTKRGRLCFCKRKSFLGKMKYQILGSKNFVTREKFPDWLW